MFTETCWIPQMTETAAAHRLVAALSHFPGVRRVRADLPNRRLTITYCRPAGPEQMRALIESLGYAVAGGLTPLHPEE